MLKSGAQSRKLRLVEDSPLRRLDPRTKLAMALAGSLAVMLPLERLLIFMGGYFILLVWARLLVEAARQVWRIRWVLLTLFIVDWLFVSLDLALIISLRLVLLAGVFALFFSTTTTAELGLALEKLGVPYRYAFSLSLAFQSLDLLDDEWRTIREAQQARGVLVTQEGWRQFVRQLGDLIALTVPAIVLTTKRAWTVTEAAYARGFDAPHRVPYRQLSWHWRDWVILIFTLLVFGFLFFWRI